MALSDVCSDFITTLVDGSTDYKTAVKRLAADPELLDGRGYESNEISELREACATALTTPAGTTNPRSRWLGALIQLVVLAEQTRAYHDTPPRLH